MAVNIDREMLMSLIARKARSLGIDAACAGVYDQNVQWLGASGDQSGQPMSEQTLLSASCISKLVTNHLILEAVEAGSLELASSWSTALPDLAAGDSNGGVTLQHLLEHSHGVDAADLRTVPLDPAGWIDAHSLLACVRERPRLHAPGALYSYGHFGYALLGAVLERLHGRRFHDLVLELFRERIGHAGIAGVWRCPSTGAGAQISVGACMALAQKYWMDPDDAVSGVGPRRRERVQRGVRALTGFNWRDCGFSHGWRYEGDGWFLWVGAQRGGAAIAIRCHPGTGSGLVVGGSHEAIRSLGEQLAELIWGLPAGAIRRPAASSGAVPMDPDCCAGTYDDGEMTLHVRASSGALSLDIERKQAAAPSVVSHQRLRRTADNLYLAFPPDRDAFHTVEFLADPASGRPSHVWNGMRVWRRLSADARSARLTSVADRFREVGGVV